MKRLTLTVGYTDANQVTHKEVEVGYVLRGADLFGIDDHPLNTGARAREFLILMKAITKFGTLKMPVPFSALVALDSIDRDDLLDAYNELESESRGGRKPEILTDDRVRLAQGVEFEGVSYDTVLFGTRLTGRDLIEADALELEASRRACYLAGRQVKQLSHFESGAKLPGPIELDTFETMIVADIFALQGGAELFRQSFRRPRGEAQKEGDAESGAPAGERDGVD